MIKIIINADDLGLSPEVNKEIRYALSNGIITSSTILANTKYWDEVHDIINSNPYASFGLHLNLTDGVALSHSNVFKKYGVVDDTNKFTKKILDFLRSGCIPIDLERAVYEEWDKQIDKIKNIENVHITHFDGHHHIHQYYALKDVLYRLLKKYNIKIIRRRYKYPKNKFKVLISKFSKIITNEIVYELILKFNIKNKYIAFLKGAVEANLWNRLFHKFLVSDYFDSYEHFCQNVKYEIKDDAVVELMCHPGSLKYAK